MATPNEDTYDVAIIGGSYAGMSAALQLVRAHRSVVVMDGGKPRNRFASKSYGYPSRDGESPSEVSRIAREQLLEYPTVTWREGDIEKIVGEEGDFTLRAESGDEVGARLVILAMGVEDQLPEVPGLRDRWGGAVFNCPYCHGYELNEGRIAVIATGEHSFEKAMLMPEWGEVTFFTNNAIELDDVRIRALDIKDVTVEQAPIQRISGEATIEHEDGTVREFDGIALETAVSISDLPAQIGCELEESVHGSIVKVDRKQATTVEGVFACGDLARSIHNITFAVADGSLAGTAAHSHLVQTD